MLYRTELSFNKSFDGRECTIQKWCSGYHYYKISFNNAWTPVLNKFKSGLHMSLVCDGDILWQWSILEIKLNALSLTPVNHFTKTCHHHLHHYHKKYFLNTRLLTFKVIFRITLQTENLFKWVMWLLLSLLLLLFKNCKFAGKYMPLWIALLLVKIYWQILPRFIYFLNESIVLASTISFGSSFQV